MPCESHGLRLLRGVGGTLAVHRVLKTAAKARGLLDALLLQGRRQPLVPLPHAPDRAVRHRGAQDGQNPRRKQAEAAREPDFSGRSRRGSGTHARDADTPRLGEAAIHRTVRQVPDFTAQTNAMRVGVSVAHTSDHAAQGSSSSLLDREPARRRRRLRMRRRPGGGQPRRSPDKVVSAGDTSALLKSTLVLEGGCTAAKVGPKHLLVSAGCVTGNAAFAAGKVLKFTSVASGKAIVDERPGARRRRPMRVTRRATRARRTQGTRRPRPRRAT